MGELSRVKSISLWLGAVAVVAGCVVGVVLLALAVVLVQ